MIIDKNYKKISTAPLVTVTSFGEKEFLKTAPLIRKFIKERRKTPSFSYRDISRNKVSA